MPMVKVTTSVPVPDRDFLAAALSAGLSDATGKPEAYIQVVTEENAHIMLGADSSIASAFVEVRGIGSFAGKNAEISKIVCGVLSGSLGIPMNRIYINFMEFESKNWGWNGGTF